MDKYVSELQLLDSRKEIRLSTSRNIDTFAGIIILLLSSEKLKKYYYKADMSLFSNYANLAFTLKNTTPKTNEKFWYALLTPNWAENSLEKYLSNKKVNVLSFLITIFWYKDLNFILSQKQRLIELIDEKDFSILFEENTVQVHTSNNPINRDSLLRTITNGNTEVNNQTVKYDDSFIKYEAGALSAAVFGQSLYASLDVRTVINVFDFDILNEFESDTRISKILNFPQLCNSTTITKGTNILLYGVAGVGKSYTIKKITGENEAFIERIVFHPDYMNTDFIGQIMPSMKGEQIEYKFRAGSFTRILKEAIFNPSNHYYLVIEEINRGNAPAIFGEIFQLLDRQADGSSTYQISNEFIAKEIYGENQTDKKIQLPANLTILATMNTADQNVFTLDTAFQRRWTMRMIENNIDSCAYKNMPILDTGVTWGVFNQVLNNFILDTNKDTLSSEDKRLGAYFIREDELQAQSEDGIPFAEKGIKYLWDDVFKFNKSTLFEQKVGNTPLNSLDAVLRLFKNNVGFSRFDIFNSNIRTLLSQGINTNVSSSVSETPNEP